MPVPGLSLLGFLDQAKALEHLATACVPDDPEHPALLAEWTKAKVKLGAATARAGHPEILDIPTAGQAHITQLASQQWVQGYLAIPGFTSGFSMAEIGPLLAFQQTVNVARSSHHGAQLSSPPSLDEMLNLCLPINPVSEDYVAHQQLTHGKPGSLIIRGKSLNLRIMQAGQINGQISGILIGPALPLAQVSEFNGRHYLSNGFHRAYCLARAGATHMPCMMRKPATPDAVGINDGTFDLGLLESPNPPTVDHFINHRAYDVQLRSVSRVINVNWSEWVLPNE